MYNTVHAMCVGTSPLLYPAIKALGIFLFWTALLIQTLFDSSPGLQPSLLHAVLVEAH